MENKNILMLAAENDALPGAKVGGIADVIRDLPKSLVDLGVNVSTIIPSYGFLLSLPNTQKINDIEIQFSGKIETIELYEHEEFENAHGSKNKVKHFIVHHPYFSSSGNAIYCDDVKRGPFASDSTKFALFNLAVAELVEQEFIPVPDVIHAHDWHTAYLLILKEFDSRYRKLKKIKTVFSIHNMAMQGQRVFFGDPSSFETWFPELQYDKSLLADPRYPQCVNPMRAAILLADKVHTVSPNYAREILLESDPDVPRFGGEGLEKELIARKQEGNLQGILNGCMYPRISYKKPAKSTLIKLTSDTLWQFIAKNEAVHSSHLLAMKRLDEWKKQKASSFLMTSVGRLTHQKVSLFQTLCSSGRNVIAELLTRLNRHGRFILLGSGDSSLERFFTEMSSRHSNFIFIKGFSSELSEALYISGDLFLMPSSFEPCGISQMLAMRAGQPCMVNNVGGLKDTVEHLKTGFVFDGKTQPEQTEALLLTFDLAFEMFMNKPDEWKKMRAAAKKMRFDWNTSANKYIETLYSS